MAKAKRIDSVTYELADWIIYKRDGKRNGWVYGQVIHSGDVTSIRQGTSAIASSLAKAESMVNWIIRKGNK